jgi:hypothetical protein
MLSLFYANVYWQILHMFVGGDCGYATTISPTIDANLASVSSVLAVIISYVEAGSAPGMLWNAISVPHYEQPGHSLNMRLIC